MPQHNHAKQGPASEWGVPPEPQPSAPQIHRIEQLDSLRGLAALIVFCAHCWFLYPAMTPAMVVLAQSPVRFLFDGHPAVLFFFLLSGFVLYLPYTRRRSQPYLPYAIRRVCRIYFPYLAGIAFAAIASSLFFHPVGDVGGAFAWHALTRSEFLKNAVLFAGFILPINRSVWNASTWSLAEEMRISLLFPLLALAVRTLSWKRMLVVLCLVSLSCAIAIHFAHHDFPFLTVHYSMIFCIGALVAKHHQSLSRVFSGLRSSLFLLLLVAAIGIIDYSSFLSPYMPHLFAQELCDLLITIANAVLLVAALASPRLRSALLLPPVRVLGRISYSFYLLHLPVLLASVCLLWTRIPHMALFAVALIVTTLLAMISYRWIELPCIALGKHLAARLQSNKH